MVCYESGRLQPTEQWVGPHCTIKVQGIVNTVQVIIRITLPGIPFWEMPLIEDQEYTITAGSIPFTVVAHRVWFGQVTDMFAEFRTCDIGEDDIGVVDGILDIINFVKSRVLMVIDYVIDAQNRLSELRIMSEIVTTKIEQAWTMISQVKTQINNELDVMEDYLYWKFEQTAIRINNVSKLYKEDIIKAISTIPTPDMSQIREDIKADIVQLGQTLSNKIIEDIWNYIEDDIFEEK